MQSKTSYVQKKNGKYCVRSEKNSDWSGGCYDTKEEAEERLSQVEMFKHMKKATVEKIVGSVTASVISGRFRRASILENMEVDPEWLEGFFEAGKRNHELIFGKKTASSPSCWGLWKTLGEYSAVYDELKSRGKLDELKKNQNFKGLSDNLDRACYAVFHYLDPILEIAHGVRKGKKR